ncbi:hypothetical protein LZ32DRAFT_39289 [Colletotrichum eremochloae]|nr:hypothetical protein LZ32DRAFT_39289 [Colletotrichum eremochloae]
MYLFVPACLVLSSSLSRPLLAEQASRGELGCLTALRLAMSSLEITLAVLMAYIVPATLNSSLVFVVVRPPPPAAAAAARPWSVLDPVGSMVYPSAASTVTCYPCSHSHTNPHPTPILDNLHAPPPPPPPLLPPGQRRQDPEQDPRPHASGPQVKVMDKVKIMGKVQVKHAPKHYCTLHYHQSTQTRAPVKSTGAS